MGGGKRIERKGLREMAGQEDSSDIREREEQARIGFDIHGEA